MLRQLTHVKPLFFGMVTISGNEISAKYRNYPDHITNISGIVTVIV